jgi:phenylacetate-CoA ligase
MTAAVRYANTLVERLDARSLVILQEARALAQVRRAYASNPFYRSLYQSSGLDPDRLESLADFYERVPVLVKSDLMADQSASPPFGRRAEGGEATRQFVLTSGTSGAGQEVHPLAEDDVEALGTAFMFNWRWAGLEPADSMFFTLPFGLTGVATYCTQACRSYGVTTIVAGMLDTASKLLQVGRLRPSALIATPSYLHRLTTEAHHLGLDLTVLGDSLRFIMVNSESFSLEWAQATQETWGTALHEWYGSTQSSGNTMGTCEGGAVWTGSGDARRGILHGFDHLNLIEVRDPESGELVGPGEYGEIYVTNLQRRKFPNIRFRTGDRVRYLGRDVCPCGRSMTCYESGTIGRYDDVVKVRGMNVWPSAIDAIVMRDGAFAEYRVTVYTDPLSGAEQVRLEVEQAPSVTPDQVPQLLDDLARTCRANLGVRVAVTGVDAGTLPRWIAKPKRWHDERITRTGAGG